MLSVYPVLGMPEVVEGDDIPKMLISALKHQGGSLENDDIVVVKQKIVSKSEGRLVQLKGVKPGSKAKELAKAARKDARFVELILRESRRIVRVGHGVIIAETKSGLVCANAGIDKSNVREGYVALLPVNPDLSARSMRLSLENSVKKRLAVVVSDTFGRPWRNGQTDVAIGCSGIRPIRSYKGETDGHGHVLRVTEPAIVDELASAAELVMGKLSGTPAAIVRGAEYERRDEGMKDLLMPAKKDLFR